MKHFTLTLGESRFVLSLDRACAELLPALYPTARSAEDSQNAEGHYLRLRRTDQGFEIETVASSAVRRRLTHPALAVLALEEEIERTVIAEADRHVTLHGGAVSTPAGACLMLGNSDSGKSSTTFQLAELGHPVLCEEITLCDPASWRVFPYPQTLSLSESLIAEFTANFPVHGRLHRLVPPVVRYEPCRFGNDAAPTDRATRILLPRFQVQADTRFESIRAEDALPEVLGYSFPPNVETETQFDRMIELLERVEIARFVYSSAAAARAALSELFSS
ncbi:MAG: hypothetical protein GY769_14675 [bacterium]|nr:hypothetical protein [bacterium]